jgi:hypothetical protein
MDTDGYEDGAGETIGISLSTAGVFAFDNSVGTIKDTPVRSRGYMSISKDLMIGIANAGGGPGEFKPSFIVAIKNGTLYSQADLEGDWHLAEIEAGNNRDLDASFGTLTFDSAGNMSGSVYSFEDDATEDVSVAGMTATFDDTGRGNLTFSPAGTYYALLSESKQYGVMVEDNGASGATIRILIKK